MNKEQPIIIQFDGDENYLTVADLVCFNMGLEIKVKAAGKKVTELVERLKNKELKPDIAIISAFLYQDHSDGEKIATQLREWFPEIKIIAYTILPDAEWGDILALKSPKEINHTLIQALETLTSKKFRSSNVAES